MHTYYNFPPDRRCPICGAADVRPGVVAKKIKAVEYVELKSVLPRRHRCWFFEALANTQPPFSWGDNDMSLVTADRLLGWCEPNMPKTTRKTLSRFYERLGKLGCMLVDLEN